MVEHESPPRIASGSSLISAEMAGILIYLTGTVLAVVLAFRWWPQVMPQGELVPAGPDAFYHARRILDTVAHPNTFSEFDPLIHAPEGSWLVWPWGFDYLIALLVRAADSIGIGDGPAHLVALVPVFWIMINGYLFYRILRELRLPLHLSLVAMLCFGLSPLTQGLHGAGRIDHHFVEHSFVLLSLLAGMRCIRLPNSAAAALLFGTVLGFAPAFHSGLFVLQIPLLIWACLGWFRGGALRAGSMAMVAAGLLFGALAALLPSEPFRLGFFSYYYLSWFHLYVTASSSLLLLLFQRLEAHGWQIAGMFGLCLLLVVPLVPELRAISLFVTLDLAEIAEMVETKSVFGHTAAGAIPWRVSWQWYSGLVFLLPAGMTWMLWRVIKGERPEMLYFFIFSLFGALLLLQQYRLFYFGYFALFLPLLIALSRTAGWSRAGRVLIYTSCFGVLIIAYTPAVAFALRSVPATFEDYYFARPLYLKAGELCADGSEIVLADAEDGHYIRYHGNCAVIANSMILTRQHHEKRMLVREMLNARPSEIQRRWPWVRYVLVNLYRVSEFVETGQSPFSDAKCSRLGLEARLLASHCSPPAGFRAIAVIRTEDRILAALYEIVAR